MENYSTSILEHFGDFPSVHEKFSDRISSHDVGGSPLSQLNKSGYF